MPAVCINDDLAGGKLIASQSTVIANGKAIIVDGDSIESHGLSTHAAATIIATSSVFIGGKKVAMTGDTATCAHVATGSSTVFVG